MGIWFVYIGTWPAATRVLSRGRERTLGTRLRWHKNIIKCICSCVTAKTIWTASMWCPLKFAWIFDLGHCSFLKAHSFLWALFMENCLLFGTDNVHGQTSKHIFELNRGYCSFITFTHQAWQNVHTFISIKMKHFPIKVQALMSLHWNGFLRINCQILIFITYNLKGEVNMIFLVFKFSEEEEYCTRKTTVKKLGITINTF